MEKCGREVGRDPTTEEAQHVAEGVALEESARVDLRRVEGSRQNAQESGGQDVREGATCRSREAVGRHARTDFRRHRGAARVEACRPGARRTAPGADPPSPY